MNSLKNKIWLQALIDIKDVLEECKCNYFLDTGTLLGAVRDKAFIPWDNDIDLGVAGTVDTTVICRICERMYKKGYNATATRNEIDIFDESGLLNLGIKFYQLVDNEFCASLGKICGSLSMHSLYMSISNDIIFKKGYKKYYLKSLISILLRKLSFFVPSFIIDKIYRKANVVYKTVKVPKEYFLQFENLAFLGDKFQVPSRYQSYLEYRYGKSWMTPNKNYNYITDDKSIKK